MRAHAQSALAVAHLPAASFARTPRSSLPWQWHPNTVPATFKERLTPGPVVWLVLVGFALTVAVAYGSALGPLAGVIMGAGLCALVLSVTWVASPVISVTEGQLHAGPAVIPLDRIASVLTLDDDEMTLARDGRHPHADARSYTVVRPWSGPRGVLIRLTDAQDPHPAWVVTSRRPNDLRAVLELSERG